MTIKLTDDQRRCAHGKILIKTANIFFENHDNHFVVYVLDFPIRTTTTSFSKPWSLDHYEFVYNTDGHFEVLSKSKSWLDQKLLHNISQKKSMPENMSYGQSEFWQLRRKSAVILSKWLFWQNSLMISWTTLLGNI